MDLSAVRLNYQKQWLDEARVNPNAIRQLETWISDADKAECMEFTAMSLATVSESGQPLVRIVLLKYIDENGLYFFTNYESQKGRDIAKHPEVGAMFFWPELERQVRVVGKAEKVSGEISDHYFNERPAESRISAIVSPQSKEIPNREYLETQWNAEKERKGMVIERPEYWGGYLIKPHSIEFWQGRPNRLHDRLLYRKNATGWDIVRLAP